MDKSTLRSAAQSLDLPKILHHIAGFASSDLGREACERLEPCSDLEIISIEHNQVSEMKSVLEGENTFPIDGIKDIRLSLHHASLENSILTAKELFDVATTINSSQTIKRFIEKRKDSLVEIAALTSNISIPNEIEFNIFQAINENAEVKDSASKELKNVRTEILQKHVVIRKALEKILRATSELGMTQDEIVTTRDGRMVIPIKSEHKNKFPGFIHSTSSSGQTVFIEPSETLTLNNDICELYFREKREIERILRELTCQVRINLETLKKVINVLTTVDLIYAKAHYSIEIKGNKPFLKEKGSIVIQNGIHPILLLKHKREMIVSLNVEIGNRFNTLLITGPNAGGKTVALKSVGLLALFVQCGIHIPASPDSEFPVFKKIFVLVGDNQSIENDLSTFSSQVLQLKEIVEGSDELSLVLVDEIGSNTDPSEGGAIAASILDYLNSSGALTIATSHQASLKAFAHNTVGMENAAMEFDQVSLLPTYKLKVGIPGSSYALEIAERLGLDTKIVLKSRELLGDQKTKLEQLIIDLEKQSQEFKNKLKETDANLLKYKKLNLEYESKLKSFRIEVKDIKKRSLEEARQLLSDASAQIERTVKEIKTKNADKVSIKESKIFLNQLDSDLKKFEEELFEKHDARDNAPIDIEINDIVILKSGGQAGIVMTLPDKKGNLTVAFNSIKAKINVDNIDGIKKNQIQAIPVTSAFISNNEISNEVDVRGLYSDEAVSTVDKFLDNAMLSGFHRVDIIHGKGTGALRKSINNFLQHDQRVKSQRMGDLNEGGAGVTVVELN